MIRNIAKTLGLAMLAGLLAFAACDEGGTAPPSAGSITGDVTMEGRGLDGVSVTLSNGTTVTTTTGGSFRFEGIAPGTYEVTISGYPAHAAFGATSMSVTVGTRGDPATVAFGATNSDRIILEALYDSAGGAGWTRRDNWGTSAPLGDWYGVTTDANGRVAVLFLSENNLRGTIPAAVGGLARLEFLGLFREPGLTGPIPSELGNLANLRLLALGGNNLTGAIPAELGNLTELTALYLWGNKLTGAIPSELGNLSKLQALQLDGPLASAAAQADGFPADSRPDAEQPPPGLAVPFHPQVHESRDRAAESADIAASHSNIGLTGPIPPGIWNLTDLTLLTLGRNRLTGGIPPAIGNLTKLEQFSVQDNQLTGAIPAALWTLTDLTVLAFSGNQLTGSIPPAIGNFANLEFFWAANNNLSGSIPSEIGSLDSLTHLGLHDNSLTGTVPASLGNLSSLVQLTLSRNDLRGAIPPELGNLANLELLYLNQNRLDGGIPPELGALDSLTSLSLRGNQLTGAMPPEIGNLSKLVQLWVHTNPLSGPLPLEMTMLANLSVFNFSDTRLCVPDDQAFVSWLQSVGDVTGSGLDCGAVSGDRDALVALYNATDGPNWTNSTNWLTNAPLGEWYGVKTDTAGRVVRLHLQGNNLSGPLPYEIGALANLEWLHLGGNNLTGPIPPEIGDLTSLRQLYLWGNSFSGPLPDSFVRLLHVAVFSADAANCVPATAPFTAWLQRISVFVTGTIRCHPDAAALVALYENANGPNWTNYDNWLTPAPLGEWYGVSAGGAGRVLAIDLPNNNLVGSIPSELGQLSQLRALDLSDNQLAGKIPSALANLSHLTDLFLDHNQLTGPIPDDFSSLSLLERFHFSGNDGLCVPDTDEFVTWLTSIEVVGSSCALGRERTALEELYKSTGGESWNEDKSWLTDAPVSEWYGVVTTADGRVTSLDLFGNDLAGSIPPEIVGLRHLELLNLGSNRIDGTIPVGIGRLTSLREIRLGGNPLLTGPLPAELGNLQRLEWLGLWNTGLTGAIPPEIGNLAELRTLGIVNNSLTDSIPPELGNLANLETLNLAGNTLTGSIPPELGNLSQLNSLNLAGNVLTGPVPPWLGTLTDLESLNLSDNELTGTLPREMGAMSRLKHLRLSGNALTGVIPSSMTAIKGMETLSFWRTELCVSIRSWLASIPYVVDSGRTCSPSDRDVLVALYNAAGGPSWTNARNWLTEEPIHLWAGISDDGDGRVAYIDLENNGLKGEILPELGQLPNLISLNLSDNPRLLGPIPVAAGSFPRLQTLDLSRNSLTGPIPPAIGNLAKLQSLDVSRNPIRGPIPSEIGKLAELRTLDVSSSFVSGTLPAEIGNLGNLFALRLTSTQLVGALPSALTALALSEFHFRNTRLCVTPPVQTWFDALPLRRIRPHNYSTSGLTCAASDHDILVALYNATGGPGWQNSGGWRSNAPLKDWYGVGTDSDGRVTVLRLPGNLLAGDLPSSLWTLPNLTTLDLSGNGHLTGSIAPEIGNLRGLVSLRLDGTALSGPIPAEIGKLLSLRELRLVNVPRLSGSIPREIGNLRNLMHLNLDFNTGLSGEIPPGIGNLANLRTLSLQHVPLTGTIPPELRGLTQLTRLDLSDTQLTGPIPREIGALADLDYLDLSNTSMWGSIPTAMTGLRRLNTFDYSDTYICVNGIAEQRRLILPWLQSIPVPNEAANMRCANNIVLAQGIHKIGQGPISEGNRNPALAPVPLIARDSTMVRVFVTNDLRDGQHHSWPDAHARFYNPGNPSPVYSVRLQRGPVTSPIIGGGRLLDPYHVSQQGGNLVGNLRNSLNGIVPEWVMWPGVEMEVEIDPEGKGHPRFRERLRTTVPLVSVEPVTLTIVPFIWLKERDKYQRLADQIKNQITTLLDQQFSFMQHALPISDATFSVRLREPWLTYVKPENDDLRELSKLLRELRLARAVDRHLGSLAPGLNYYQGFIWADTVGGVAYRPGWVSLSTNSPVNRAHELGHNMGLRHTPAHCFPEIRDPDPEYPNPTGKIDAWGYGQARSEFSVLGLGMINPSRISDVMSYCDQQWISEYHFRKALSATQSPAAHAESVFSPGDTHGEVLLLWGGVDAQGDLVLDPSFFLDLQPSVPQTGGPYRLVGRNAVGADLFSLNFEMSAEADGGTSKGFMFALPTRPEWADDLATITLSGPEGSVSMDQSGELAMALLFEETTGRLRGVLRDQRPEQLLAADSRAAFGEPGLRVEVSRGVPEHRRR